MDFCRFVVLTIIVVVSCFVLVFFHIAVVGSPSPLSCVYPPPHHQLPRVLLYWLQVQGW